MSFLINPFIFGGAASRLWIPTDAPGIFTWLDGSTNTGSNGDPIDTWTDASGNSHFADNTGGGTTRPTLDTTGLNGYNVVDAAGNSSQLFNLTNSYSALSEISAFAVLKRNSDPAADSQRSGGWHRLGGASFITDGNHYPFTDGVIYDGFGSSTRKTTGNPTLALTSWHINSVHSKASSYEMYLNDVQHFSTGTNTVSITTAPNIFHGQSSSYYDGKCAMIVILSTYPTTGTRQKMEGYLAHYFGIQSVLDAGHPYKSSPPMT